MRTQPTCQAGCSLREQSWPRWVHPLLGRVGRCRRGNLPDGDADVDGEGFDISILPPLGDTDRGLVGEEFATPRPRGRRAGAGRGDTVWSMPGADPKRAHSRSGAFSGILRALTRLYSAGPSFPTLDQLSEDPVRADRIDAPE